jgi:O-antigen ligase
LDEILQPKLWHGFIFLKVIILIMLFIQILFNLTRSAWLGLSVGLVFYFSIDLINNRRRKNILIFTGMVTFVIAASLFILTSESFELVRDRIIKDSFTERSIQEEERAGFYYAQKALKLAKDHPFGLGIGQTGLLGSDVEDLSLGAHNSYIHILSDMGLLTFVAFMLIIITMLIKITPGALKRRTQYGLSYQTTLSNIIVLIAAGLYQDLILWLPMWLFPAFLTILVFPKDKKSILRERRLE